jgi:aspartate aminotransferase
MTQKTRELKRQGRDVLGLSAGEPDFDTPGQHQGRRHPRHPRGQDQIHRRRRRARAEAAIADKFKRENGLDYKPSQVNVSPGGKAVIFNALMATCSPATR